MPKRALLLAALLVGASAASADEMLVFRKDSKLHGAAMRVRSYQEKDGHLLIQGTDGGTFTAPLDSIDKALSQAMTEKLRRDDAAAAARARAEASRRKLQSEAKKPAKKLGLVEASRRYGVADPGISTSEASAPRMAPAKPAEADPAAKPPSEPELASLRSQIEAVKKERERIAKDVDALEKDNNPDPLSAAQRESRLADTRKELAAVDAKLASLTRSLAAGEAAAKAK